MDRVLIGNFKGPKGDDGAQGATGPEGKQGIQGIQGPSATINGLPAIEIEAGNNIELTQDDAKFIINAQVTNKSLLINWDFTNPVNRNGKTEYSGNRVWSIDRWMLLGSGDRNITVNDGYITCKSSQTWAFRQYIEPSSIEPGQTYTLSFLLDDDLVTSNLTLGDTVRLITNGKNVELGFISENDGICVYIYSYSNGQSLNFIAAKFEFGSVQTLAHQDEEGNWILNEASNFAEQYALCEQYSPITGEFVGSQHSNDNLLINPYFIGGGSQQGGGQFPINQGGETEYTAGAPSSSTEYVRALDRWWVMRGAKINVATRQVTIPANVTYPALCQTIVSTGTNSEELTPYLGKTLTLSVMVSTTDPLQMRIIYGAKGTDEIITTTPANFSGCFSVTGTIPETATQLGVQIGRRQAIANEMTFTIDAVKLEFGPVQTLAHKEGDKWVLNDPPPNFQQELAKCQRYQVVYNFTEQYQTVGTGSFNGTGKYVYVSISLPVPLRGKPVITSTGSLGVSNQRLMSDDPIHSLTLWSSVGNVVVLRMKVDRDDYTTGDMVFFGIYGPGPAQLIIDAN